MAKQTEKYFHKGFSWNLRGPIDQKAKSFVLACQRQTKNAPNAGEKVQFWSGVDTLPRQDKTRYRVQREWSDCVLKTPFCIGLTDMYPSQRNSFN